MPWFYLCNYCGTKLKQGETSGDTAKKELSNFINGMKDKIVKCYDCKKMYEFDTEMLLNKEAAKNSGKKIVIFIQPKT